MSNRMSNSRFLQAVIIDDENHCRQTLEKLLEWIKADVKVVASIGDPMEALKFLNANKVDLVFLDIDMPTLNGFELLSSLDDINFDIIFTTAYNEFALKAFEVQAQAYLLKPITEEDLAKAVHLVQSRTSNQPNQDKVLGIIEKLKKRTSSKKIAIPTAEGLVFLEKDSIVRCESEGNYTKIYTTDKKQMLVSKTLKVVVALLDDDELFVRPHASHLINVKYVSKYIKGSGGHLIMEDGHVVPVSKNKKSSFFDSLH